MQPELSDKVWAFIHGQMPRDEIAGFESLIRADRELDAEVRDCRALDGLLRRLLPVPDMSDRELEDLVLQKWEESRAANATAATPRTSGPHNILEFFGAFRLPSARLAYAAAACLVLCAAAYLAYPVDPLAWSEPAVSGPATRGAASDRPEAVYSKVEADSACRELGRLIGAEYKRKYRGRGSRWGVDKKKHWSIGMHFQELRDGRFTIEITAKPGKYGARPADWTGFFMGMDDFKDGARPLADLIAGDLWRYRNGEQPRKEP